MNLLKALATVSGMTLLSRILGFVRDFVIARIFGAGMLIDAFFVAFKLPNLLRRPFAEGAFSASLRTDSWRIQKTSGEAEAKRLVDHVATLLFLALLVVTLIGMAAAPLLVYISAPGFAADAGKSELTNELTRITFPYILFMSLVALSGGILNTWSRFAIPAFTPVLLNLAMIGMALFATPSLRPAGDCTGCRVSRRRTATGTPATQPEAHGMLPRFALDWKDEGVRRILRLMAPAVLGVSVAQISLLINTIFFAFVRYRQRLLVVLRRPADGVPLGMLGAALGTIPLPSLAKYYASENFSEYSKLLDCTALDPVAGGAGALALATSLPYRRSRPCSTMAHSLPMMFS